MSKFFLISDMGVRHLLQTNGLWAEMPTDNAVDLLSFATQSEAADFCREQLKTGCHCRPYQTKHRGRGLYAPSVAGRSEANKAPNE